MEKTSYEISQRLILYIYIYINFRYPASFYYYSHYCIYTLRFTKSIAKICYNFIGSKHIRATWPCSRALILITLDASILGQFFLKLALTQNISSPLKFEAHKYILQIHQCNAPVAFMRVTLISATRARRWPQRPGMRIERQDKIG